MGRGYTGGSLKRQTQPHEIANSPHALCRASFWRQSLAPKLQAITQRQLPPLAILPSFSSSSLPIYCWHLSSVLRKTLRFICNYRRVICPLPANRVSPATQHSNRVCLLSIFVEALLPFAAQRLPAPTAAQNLSVLKHTKVFCPFVVARGPRWQDRFSFNLRSCRARWVWACFSYFWTGGLCHGYGVRRH
jgi:hypothetical protein